MVQALLSSETPPESHTAHIRPPAIKIYQLALLVSLVFHLYHVLSVPLLMTYDGWNYVQLAELLFTDRFTSEWYWVRTPLYPLLLRSAFWLLGKQPLALIVAGSVLGFVGTWSLGSVIRRTCGPGLGAATLLLATVNPYVVTYEHTVLTEAGTFCLLALLVNLLLWPTHRSWMKSLGLIILLIAAYYFRSNLLYLSPPVALLYLLEGYVSQRSDRSGVHHRRLNLRLLFRRTLPAFSIAIIPFLAAMPWQRTAVRAGQDHFLGQTLLAGLLRHAVFPPGDPALGEFTDDYDQALQESLRDGKLDWNGMPKSQYLHLSYRMAKSHGLKGKELFLQQVFEHPVRYLRGVGRTLGMFANFPHIDSQNDVFRDAVLSADQTGAKFLFGGKKRAAMESHFAQITGRALLLPYINALTPLFQILIFVGFSFTVITFAIGCARLHPTLVILAGIPLVYLLTYALSLAGGVDRYAFPAYPLLIANILVLAQILVTGARASSRALTRPALWLRCDGYAFRLMLALVGLLALTHTVFAILSRGAPSADEARYMAGATAIAESLGSGSLGNAWASFRSALGSSPPLISVPASVLMLPGGPGVRPALLSLVLIFLALASAGYSLFRNFLARTEAALAVTMLLTMPLVTGLTHRFYAEGLLLCVSILYLDVLLRHRWKSTGWSVASGSLLGLGALSKITFLPMLLPSTLFLWLVEVARVHRGPGRRRALTQLLINTLVMLLVGFAVAWTWYGPNGSAALDHARESVISGTTYPVVYWFFAVVSSGPYLFTSLLALMGLVFLRRVLADAPPREREAWWSLLILAGTTVLLTTVASAKAVRFTVTWLPAVAALAAVAPVAWLGYTRRALQITTGAAALSLLLALHNSFAILPFGAVAVGDLKLLDSSYPLDTPDRFEGNRPLERAVHRRDSLIEVMAQDARTWLPDGSRASVLLTADSPGLNHDWLNLSARWKGYHLSFFGPDANADLGPLSADYIVDPEHSAVSYPGKDTLDSPSSAATASESPTFPFRRVRKIDGPDGTLLHILRNRLVTDSLAERSEQLPDGIESLRSILAAVSALHPERLFDGIVTQPENYGVQPNGRPMLFTFRKPTFLRSLRLHLWDFDDRTYAFSVEAITAGVHLQRIALFPSPGVAGVQEIAMPDVPLEELRITGIYNSNQERNPPNTYFHLKEIEFESR